jgi:hypothetical protein
MSLQDFQQALFGKADGVNVRALERDYRDLANHVRAMDNILAGRGQIGIVDASDGVDVIVTTAPVNGAQRELVIHWRMTANAIVWQRARGTLPYPLTAFEYINHQARDAFIKALNSDVAAVIHG